MKPKRKIISLLLAICIVAGLLPTTAFALDGDKTIMLGTSGISDPTSTQNNSGTYYTPSDYVYFGVYESDPIKWRVLDADEANDNSTDGMFLLSEYLLGSDVVFESAGNSDDGDGQSQPNEWQNSDAQNWCREFARNTGVFSTAEQAAFLGVAKNDRAEDPLYGLSWGASRLTDSDKVFFLSVRELADYVSSYDNSSYDEAPGLSATDTEHSKGSWWLRSPITYMTDRAGYVRSDGYVLGQHVTFDDWAARPAFNLNLSSVLFTSAAEGGKSASGMDAGLTAVGDYDGNEWKLTLLDSSRNFSVTETTAEVKSGGTITLNYTGATAYDAGTAPNEYISAMIVDSSGVQYYGRIAQPTSADGQVQITIPAALTDGTYTLNVFSEQYNGDKKTDYASAFKAVDLTVSSDTTAPTLSNGSATRDSETNATVKFTSNEAGSYYYAVVESNEAAPNIVTTGTGTACDTTEQTISLNNLLGAGAKDIYIVVKDAAGNVSEKLKIEIPAYVAPSYGISASPAALNFGSATEGYSSAPAAQTVTITNTGNQTITLNQPAATDFNIGPLSTTDLVAGGTATFTVQPKTGLTAGSHSETLNISGSDGTSASVGLSFYTLTVNLNGGSSSGSTTYPITVEDSRNGEAESNRHRAERGDTVTITVDPDRGYELDELIVTDSSGDEIEVRRLSNGKYTFTMPRSAVTVEAVFTAAAAEGTFADVSPDAYYADAVEWAVANGITGGTTATTFSPNNPCTRAHAVTFLWRAAGEPEPETTAMPFTDVAEGAYYYDAVLWAMENGITEGTTETTFSPDAPCTRAQIVTFLWRSEGKPAPQSAMGFTDVAAGAYYFDAVAWAVENGITNGTSAAAFSPYSTCTRAQIVTFIYRCMA